MKDTRINAVIFDEENHRYYYQSGDFMKELRGITGTIGRLTSKSYPDTAVVKLASVYGKDVHKEVELWIKTGRTPFTESGKWIVSFLKDKKYKGLWAEKLVSDFVATASAVDAVGFNADGTADLYDVKTTGNFYRDYCTYQLSVYKYLFEKVYGVKVNALYVLSPRSKRCWTVFYAGDPVAEMILKRNSEGK